MIIINADARYWPLTMTDRWPFFSISSVLESHCLTFKLKVISIKCAIAEVFSISFLDDRDTTIFCLCPVRVSGEQRICLIRLLYLIGVSLERFMFSLGHWFRLFFSPRFSLDGLIVNNARLVSEVTNVLMGSLNSTVILLVSSWSCSVLLAKSCLGLVDLIDYIAAAEKVNITKLG